jgi:hypothetical protein
MARGAVNRVVLKANLRVEGNMQPVPLLHFDRSPRGGSTGARVRWPGRGRAALAMAQYLVLVGALTPALAFDDQEFCVVAQQLAAAAEKDVGVWIDRTTRNAGMAVFCDKKTVEFTRFTYAPSASMDQAWKERKGADWNVVHCTSAVWNEAIRNGWKVVLSQNSADGGRALIAAACDK